MIFHNQYSMPISRISLMLETESPELISISGLLPKRVVKKYYIKFMYEFNNMFASSGNELVRSETAKIMMWHKVKNILPLLRIGLMYNPSDYNKGIFEFYFGYIPDDKSIEPIERINQEIERLTKRYKDVHEQIAKEPEGTVSFEDIVISVEAILEQRMDRQMKLYQFKKYYDLSLHRVKESKRRAKA